MARLQIALQDGFDGDTVAISVDGREAYRRGAVTTRTQISLADTVELDVPDAPVRLEVAVESRGIRDAVEVDPTRQPNVTVSVRDGVLVVGFPERIGFA